jgi:type II secretory pathway component PulJ
MRMKSKNSSSRFASKGLTLIEVVMATALMSTVLVGMISVFQKHRSQLLQASRKLEAVQGMNLLLAGWFSDETKWPKFPTQGRLQEGSDLVWNARPVRQMRLGSDHLVDVIILTVVSESNPQLVLTEAEFLALVPKQENQVESNGP